MIAWIQPDNGGSIITGYSITIRQSDLNTFSADLTNCDQSASTITTCTIPVSSLRNSPFSLEWGSSVYVKVAAINNYGTSEVSSEGNGAVITTTPDAPISLVEETSLKTKSSISLTWSPAPFTGGAVIIDY